MKMKLMIAVLLIAPTLALRAEDKPGAPASVPATTTASTPVLEDAFAMQKKILRKLEDLDLRLDRIEAALKTSAAADRKLDAIERDVRDIRRDTQRIK